MGAEAVTYVGLGADCDELAALQAQYDAAQAELEQLDGTEPRS